MDVETVFVSCLKDTEGLRLCTLPGVKGRERDSSEGRLYSYGLVEAVSWTWTR